MDKNEVDSNENPLFKKTLMIAVKLFLGIIIFVIIVMLVFAGKIFWEPLLLIIGMAIILVIVIALIAYAISKKNPKLVATSESKPNQRNWSIFTIIFGIFLAVSGIYSYLTGFNDTNQAKYIIIRVGFGLFTIIWGIYYLRKNKNTS